MVSPFANGVKECVQSCFVGWNELNTVSLLLLDLNDHGYSDASV